MSSGPFATVHLAGLSRGGGVYTREVTIGDGYPGLVIELVHAEHEGEPVIDIKATVGGLGFTDYEGAIKATREVLMAVLGGLDDPNPEVISKYVDPEGDPHAS